MKLCFLVVPMVLAVLALPRPAFCAGHGAWQSGGSSSSISRDTSGSSAFDVNMSGFQRKSAWDTNMSGFRGGSPFSAEATGFQKKDPFDTYLSGFRLTRAGRVGKSKQVAPIAASPGRASGRSFAIEKGNYSASHFRGSSLNNQSSFRGRGGLTGQKSMFESGLLSHHPLSTNHRIMLGQQQASARTAQRGKSPFSNSTSFYSNADRQPFYINRSEGSTANTLRDRFRSNPNLITDR